MVGSKISLQCTEIELDTLVALSVWGWVWSWYQTRTESGSENTVVAIVL